MDWSSERQHADIRRTLPKSHSSIPDGTDYVDTNGSDDCSLTTTYTAAFINNIIQ